MTQIDKSSIIASEDSLVINQMTDILLQHDYTVTIEKSIIKIISKLLEKEINLLILDLDAPQGLNFDSIDVIRRLRPKLPIVVLSMDNSLETLKSLVQKGVFYSAIKPVQNDEIVEVIKAISNSQYKLNKNQKYICYTE